MATTFAGYQASGITNQSGSGGRAQLPISVNLASRALPSPIFRGIDTPVLPTIDSFFEVGQAITSPVITYGGYEEPGLAPFWFELVHSFPSFFEFGNLLASVSRDIEAYSSYRDVSVTLQTITQDAGVGVSFSGISGLPVVLLAQTGFTFQVNVSATGPPVLEGDITVTFDVATLLISMTGIRVVMFPYQPESPLEETLEFNTTIMVSANGTEQRVSLRKNPRQFLNMLLRNESDATRRKIHSLIHGWQPGVFGVPIWFEARYLTAAGAINDTVIQVDTRFADFRAQSLAIIWTDEENFDALEVSSLTDTSITFSSGLTKNFAAGQALVMPLRVAHAQENIGAQRATTNLEDTTVVFRVLDNDSDLADTTAFPSYLSKVLLSEANKMSGQFVPANYNRKMHKLDNEVGAPVQTSDWLGPNILTEKGFQSSSLQRLWEIRQLLHALHGSQKSFFLPTFYHDMVVVSDTINADNVLEIEHIDYTTYINGQAPSNHLWIELADGTIHLKEILSSEEKDATTERLFLGDNWASVIPAASFARVSYLRPARLDNDSITLLHSSAGETEVSVQVREVTG